MINVVYLVLVLHHGGTRGQSMESIQIPQANMRQCEINKDAYSKNDKLVVRSYCIHGVMPR